MGNYYYSASEIRDILIRMGYEDTEVCEINGNVRVGKSRDFVSGVVYNKRRVYFTTEMTEHREPPCVYAYGELSSAEKRKLLMELRKMEQEKVRACVDSMC